MSVAIGTVLYAYFGSDVGLSNANIGWILRAWGGKSVITGYYGLGIWAVKLTVLEELIDTVPNDPYNNLPP